jgi:hypothetical protein
MERRATCARRSLVAPDAGYDHASMEDSSSGRSKRRFESAVVNICPVGNSSLSITNPVGALTFLKPLRSIAKSFGGELACTNALAPKVSQGPGSASTYNSIDKIIFMIQLSYNKAE